MFYKILQLLNNVTTKFFDLINLSLKVKLLFYTINLNKKPIKVLTAKH